MIHMTMDEDLFGRFDAAALLAVEAANGGELATLEQVVSTFLALFGESPAPARFAEACALLAEASLVEYQDEALGLTSGGRRLLRRAGTMKAAERPERLLSLLRQLDEGDLAPEGSVPAPTAEAVAAALADLDHDLESGNAPVRGDLLAPNPSSTWGYGASGGRLGRPGP